MLIPEQTFKELLEYLTESMYISGGMGWSHCSSCGKDFDYSHKESCKLSKLICIWTDIYNLTKEE